MPRMLLLLVAVAVAGPAVASLSNLVSAWGHDFAVTPFEAKPMMVAVATDRATGARFNMVKLPNGHLMALVPLDGMTGPVPVAAKDLM